MQEKYDLISISVLSFLFYGMSWIAVKSGLISKVYHRRFWNVLLLLSFLVSGGFGLFLTFQINYDWDISIADDLTFWHVDVGVAMFWVALFHIFWHLSYFGKLFKKTKSSKQNHPEIIFNNQLKTPVKYAAISLGFSTFISQIVFIREFLALFSGNELIIGILFFNWMVLIGLGAYAGRYAFRLYSPQKSMSFLLVHLAVLPVLTLFFIIFLKSKVFLSGTETGLSQIIFYSFLLLFPLNLISGFSFSLLSHIAGKIYQNRKAHLVYAYEARGSFIAGLFFNFLIIYWLDSFRSLLLLLPLNMWVAGYFTKRLKKIFVLSCFVFALLFYLPLEKFVKNQLFINQKIIYQQNAPYGNIIVTENSGQLNFYQNGDYLFSSDTGGTGSGNIAENEEAVHFAMLQVENPQKILLVSGGINGQLTKLLKYPLKNIDYLEINPALISAAKKYIRLPHSKKINYITTDVRRFLMQNKKKYDVILLNIPPPLTSETNRYYTLEFFNLLKKHLNPQGIIKAQLPPSANYLSDEQKQNFSVLFSTLSKLFMHVEVIPGEHDYFLASDSSIRLNIVELMNQKGIENEYISYYLDDFSIAQRTDFIKDRLKQTKLLNKDFKPVSYLLQIKSQLSRFKTNYWVLAGFLFLFLIFVWKNINKANYGMFAVGFASITAEMLIIFGFQVLFGNIFSMLSVIIMIFMAGLALGSLFFPDYLSRYDSATLYKISFYLLAVFLVALPFQFIYVFSAVKIQWFNYLLIFSQTLLISSVSGFLFYLSEQLSYAQSSKIAGNLYSADLFGSALAALAVSMFIVPLEGIEAAGFFAGAICVLAVFIKR
ncbi:MAG: hypothetical protein L3J74_02895 [Bacteroidales bacterium]|nr:hypothetical protein [Bacteroidales bacterium]